MAAERHIRVLLSGWGGDQGALPTGHGYLGSLMFRGHWKTVWHELRALSGGNLRRLPKVMKWHLLLPWMPDMLYDRFIPLLRHGWSPILKPAVLESIKRVAPLDKNRYRVYVGTRRHQLYELQKSSYLARIESWTVGGAEQHIEYCYPLLDRRIVEFGLGLPARQTLRNGKMRFFLRQATDGLLPAPLPWEKVGGDPVMLRANHAMSQSVQRAMIHRLAQKDIPCGRLYCLDETQVARFDATFDTSPLWSTYASAARCEYIWQAQAEHFHPIV
jgi:asparagine synthase (glutamine-hydrolysing)